MRYPKHPSTMPAGADDKLRKYLEAKAVIAGDLYADGAISRAECFRHQVDVAVQKNSGPISLSETCPTDVDRLWATACNATQWRRHQ